MSKENPANQEWADYYSRHPEVLSNWGESNGRSPNDLTEECDCCGKPIALARFGQHFKWVGRSGEWKCGNDPAFPVRGHMPKVSMN